MQLVSAVKIEKIAKLVFGYIERGNPFLFIFQKYRPFVQSPTLPASHFQKFPNHEIHRITPPRWPRPPRPKFYFHKKLSGKSARPSREGHR